MEFNYQELVDQFSDVIIQKISQFSTVFYTAEAEDTYLRTCGSGTFVQSNGSKYILTASHVIDYLKEQEEIGIAIGNSANIYKLETKYLNFSQDRASTYTENGPDLGLIEIPRKYQSEIDARKSFYNFEVHEEEVFSTFQAKELGAWVVMGFPEERIENYQKNNVRVTSCCGQLNLCGVDNERIFEEYDLLSLELAGSSHSQGISSYEGISGGGVWHIIVAKDEKGLGIHKVLLKGVVYFQLEDRGEDRSVIAHGPKSIYNFVQAPTSA